MTEKTEKTEIAESKTADREPTREPIRETAKTLVKCSHCGYEVDPQEVEGNRCPKCGKFTRWLTPEDIEEEERAKPLAPPEIEMTDRVKELLEKHLPRVYGIPAKHAKSRITAIIETLSPPVATNPYNLHNHVKRYAPGADDRHLESIIANIFSQLEAEGYKPSGQRYVPGYRGQGYPPTYSSPYAPTYPQTYPQAYPPGRPTGYEGFPQQRKPVPVKVIVDGQEIVTDLQGSMAWKRWETQQKREKAEDDARKAEETRRQELHDLEVHKFQEEIKKIAKGGEGKKTDENLVEVPLGETKIKVPATIAHLYLNQGEDPKIKELTGKIDAQNETIKSMKDEKHAKDIGDLKGMFSSLAKKIENRPTLFEQMETMDEYARRRGFKTTGRTTLDVLSDVGENIDHRAQQLLNRMPGGRGEFKPDVKRTPEERREKADRIKKTLEKKEDVLAAEDELVRAAAKM